MYYATSIQGLPLLSFSNGEKLGTIQGVIYDAATNLIKALTVDPGGLFAARKVVPFATIQSIGEDAVIIPDGSLLLEGATAEATIQPPLCAVSEVQGKKVMSEDGKDLGTITDVGVDPQSGHVAGYQVSGGIFADMYKGKPFIPAPQTIKIGESVVFVPKQTVQLMEQQSGGLKGAANDTVGSLHDLVDTTSSKIGEAKAQATSGEARQALDTTKNRMQETTQQIKEEAGTLWNQAREKVTALADQGSQKLEEGKIQAALGRPVTRVILDKEDRVVLNTGELITNSAVEQARTAGVLDILLASVYKEIPQLSSEDMKAR